MSDWRPCLGCRSYWIHVVCGGFCSECQPNPVIGNVKSIAGNGTTGKIRRSSDRSPLSVKQSQIAKRLQDSLGFKEGKENTTNMGGKRQRKPVAPPALTANISVSEKTRQIEEGQKPSPSYPPLPASPPPPSLPARNDTTPTSSSDNNNKKPDQLKITKGKLYHIRGKSLLES